MVKNALGMIEVRGLLGSIVAADVAVKTAEVHIVNQSTIKGGLTSVELFGDVGAIKEAVQSARESVSKMNCYISSNVIANLDPQVEKMILQSLSKSIERMDTNIQKTPENVSISQGNSIKSIYTQFLKRINREKIERLEDLKVTELRSLAYALELESITKKEIKFANKQTLVQKLREKGVE
ncbi:BMC domain-containing protein [Streptococcus devriesei]|uniref:BMC domain-containing protein n=1 Tax=Streptococcus devriesei TaxID=231233 RepID=UPI0004085DBE|nr:BMC domain-containing protein [Streptococcus devriesei]